MKKFLKSPWTISISSVLFAFILTILRDMITGEKVLSTFKSIFLWLWNLIIVILNFNIKVWWLFLGIGVIVFVFFLIDKFSAKTDMPDFLRYTQDTIQGMNWKWQWVKGYVGKYDLVDLELVCSNCGTPLVNRYHYSTYECLRCNSKFNYDYIDYGHIRMLIIDNARRNLFPKDEKSQDAK